MVYRGCIVVYHGLSSSFPLIHKNSHHMFSSWRYYRAWSWPVEKRWGQHYKIFHLVFFFLQKNTSFIQPNRLKLLLTWGSSGLPMWSILPAGFHPSSIFHMIIVIILIPLILTNTNCIVYFRNKPLKPKILVIALFCRDVWLPTEKLSNMGVEVFQFHVDDVPSANIAPFFR